MPRNAKQPTTIYEIKVSLYGSKPAIWRSIQVSADITLYKLHKIIQEVMGWEDMHLHQFVIGNDRYKVRDPHADLEMDESGKNERTHRLRQVVPEVGFQFCYEYDFGDGWKHTLAVERVFAPEEDVKYPRCTAGARACPPEDVGGIHGYSEFLEALRDPNHPAHQEMTDWIGRTFDPEVFDLVMTNQIIRQLFP